VPALPLPYHLKSLLIFQGLALLAYQINRLFLIEATFAYGSLTKDLEVVTHELAEESDIARRHQAVAREPATPLYDAFHSFERIQLLSR